MQGILYGVGVGPGDPELLTLAAVRVIKTCDLIAAPDSGSGGRMALAIAAEYIAGKTVIDCDMPMTHDETILFAAREKTAIMLCEHLANGKNIAFLTLGDPSVYSTYTYIHRLVQKRGYDAKIIAGVPSFCAAAAALDIPLCEGTEALHIIPAPHGDLGGALNLPGTKVLMKSGKNFSGIVDTLAAKNLLGCAMMAQRCGMPGEKITRSLADFHDEPGYFTVIVVREGNAG